MSTPLGDFLRARRDATRPETVGLPAGTRRRVPGLRRSELAQLAGISVEYLVRIEQGTDRHPSVPVVDALARALGLDATEHAHLRHLAKITDGGCAGPADPPRTDVRPTVLAVLDGFEPGVAIVTNRLGDVLAHTHGFDLIARPWGVLDRERPNLTRFVFTDARARHVFPDWDRVADERAFDLWLGPSADGAARLERELAPVAGDEFTRRLHRHARPPGGALRWRHPAVGELRFDREVMELSAADAQQLVAFLPADEATAEAVDRLRRTAATPLRAVTG